jgi:hypothetical protein
MIKSVLVSLAVLTLATSASFAAHRTHHSAMNANASAGSSPVAAPGGASSNNHEMYMRNLRESGYDTKKNFTASGNLRQQ